MKRIPRALIDYINNNIRYPVGLIGCRATNPEMSFDCCEYDIAIFNRNSESNRFFQLGDHGLELIAQKKISTTNMLNLYNMIIIQGYNGLSLVIIINQ